MTSTDVVLPKVEGLRVTTKTLHDMIPEENKDLRFLKIGKGNRPVQYVPQPILRHFGCTNCEWRGTSLCSHGIPKGKGKPLPKGMGTDYFSICRKRENFLKMIYTGKSKSPSLKQLQRDYRNWTLNTTYQRDMQRFYQLSDEIDQDPSNKELREEYDKAHDRFVSLGMELEKLDNKGLDRESREKTAANLSDTMSLGDIHRIMGAKPINVDVKEDD